MTESRTLLVDGAHRLFRDLAESRAKGFAELWPAIDEMGFASLLLPEDAGGVGGSLSDAFAVIKVAGHHALPLPLAEAMVAQMICAQAGVDPLQGLATLADRHEGEIRDGKFSGRLLSVPWGCDARRVVASLEGRDFVISVSDASETLRGANPAGEPRDTLVFDAATAVPAGGMSSFHLGALMRTAQIAGALDAALELSIAYANDRVQFGRSIGKFQAIQHNLAMFAEEAAAVTSAGEAAARAGDCGEAEFEIAAAKCRANKAASFGRRTAHAVHGAIGFTLEHPLNHLTRRLVGWRSEFGSQNFWSEWLGRRAVTMSKDGLWSRLTARSDAISLKCQEALQAAS